MAQEIRHSLRIISYETLEYEWLYNPNLSLNPEELNPRLTEWLIEYNFNRPHQSLGYLAPVEHIEKELAKIRCLVLPMWSAITLTFFKKNCYLFKYYRRCYTYIAIEYKISLIKEIWG